MRCLPSRNGAALDTNNAEARRDGIVARVSADPAARLYLPSPLPSRNLLRAIVSSDRLNTGGSPEETPRRGWNSCSPLRNRAAQRPNGSRILLFDVLRSPNSHRSPISSLDHAGSLDTVESVVICVPLDGQRSWRHLS